MSFSQGVLLFGYTAVIRLRDNVLASGSLSIRATDSHRRSANGHHVNDALGISVQAEQCIEFIVEQGTDWAIAQSQCRCCQGDVLGDVPCVEIDISVSALSVLPRAALKDG